MIHELQRLLLDRVRAVEAIRETRIASTLFFVDKTT
jgi:hypothetical protein